MGGLRPCQGEAEYDESYYEHHCGERYENSEHWDRFFGNVAERIVCIPFHSKLTRGELEEIAATIRGAAGAGTA